DRFIGRIFPVTAGMSGCKSTFEVEMRGFPLIAHCDKRTRVERLVQRFRDDHRDGLIVVVHQVVLQQRQDAACGVDAPRLFLLAEASERWPMSSPPAPPAHAAHPTSPY